MQSFQNQWPTASQMDVIIIIRPCRQMSMSRPPVNIALSHEKLISVVLKSLISEMLKVLKLQLIYMHNYSLG